MLFANVTFVALINGVVNNSFMGRVEFSEVEAWMERNRLKPAAAARYFGVTSQRFNGWKNRKQVSADASEEVEKLMERLDAENGFIAPVAAVRPAAIKDSDGEYGADPNLAIPQLDVAGAMGDGAYPPDHIDVVRMVSVRVSDLKKQCTFTSPDNLRIITGYGRSMKPTFSDGDPLLVDIGVNSIDLDAIYAFTFNERFFIKGMQRLPHGGVRVISHNRKENDPWDIAANEMYALNVHARVLLAWNANRL